jgi:hypothetical protein
MDGGWGKANSLMIDAGSSPDNRGICRDGENGEQWP